MKNFFYSVFLNKNFLNKLLAFLIIAVFLYLLRDFLIFFIITFLLGYMSYALATYINKNIMLFVESQIQNVFFKRFFQTIFSKNFIITLIYIFIVLAIFFFIKSYLPKIFFELRDLPQRIPFLRDYVNDYISQIEQIMRLRKDIQGDIQRFATEQNLGILMKIFNSLKTIGAFLVKGLLVFILSYIFVIERHPLEKYFGNTKILFLADIYEEIKAIFKKIGKWFGIIFKVQATISFTNTVLTALGLTMIGYLHGNFFPYMLTLCTIVFLFGFIPVLGTFLSSIPIVIIGFLFGGLQTAIYCIILILIIHAIETYILNPHIVSSYTHLPIAMTFLILIISEHFMGPIGLMIGVPVFFIVVDTLTDMDKRISDKGQDNPILEVEEKRLDK